MDDTGHTEAPLKDGEPEGLDQAEADDPSRVPPGDREWHRPWMGPFLSSLSLIPDVSAACRFAGIGRATAYRNRDESPGFAEGWDEALELAADYVQGQVHRWITSGMPVRKTDRVVVRRLDEKTGKLVVVEEREHTVETTERNATLAIFWLKAWMPERYRWADRIQHEGGDGAPIRVESVQRIDAQIEELATELARRAAAAGEPVPDEAERDLSG